MSQKQSFETSPINKNYLPLNGGYSSVIKLKYKERRVVHLSVPTWKLCHDSGYLPVNKITHHARNDKMPPQIKRKNKQKPWGIKI